MAHSFKLGTHYRNREGEYQVVEIHGDEMTIRYSAGKTIRTDISTQQRILDNLEIENDIAEDERLRSERSKREPRDTQVVRGSTPKFEGFSAADFGSLEGSSWRGRDALGGVLRDYLQAQTGVHFQSWAVRRRLEVHLARPDKYDFDAPLPCAKLFVYTHDDLAFGYYIETPSRQGEQDSPDRYRHWQNFRNGLTIQSTMQSVLLEPMLNHGLRMADLYKRDHIASDFGGALQCEFQFRDGSLQWYRRDVPRWEAIAPSSMFERLSRLPEDEWVDLHIFKTISQEDAIALGASVLNPILDTLRALVPLYQMTVNNHPG